MHWAVILAGGAGSRFWPASTPEHPKQLLALAGDAPLLAQAVQRLEGLLPNDRILIVTGRPLVPSIRELLPHVPPDNLLVEPRSISTAPALAWASAEAARRDRDATVLSLHADWAIANDAEFRATARRALDSAARHDVLVTVGVPPIRPEPGYGYIVPGEPLDDVARRVVRFVEKPERAKAQALIATGALWNSGLFAWTSRRFAIELAAHARELQPGLDALAAGDVAGFFAAVAPAPVDTAVLERSRRVAVVPATFGWDDVGTWAALSRVRPADALGNVAHGPTALVDAQDCVVWNEGEPIVLAGVSDLVVVSANGITLVTSRDGAVDLKAILARLPPDLAGDR